MGNYLARLRQSALGRFFSKFSADEASFGAILIAWQSLLSLFPILIAALAIFSLFIRDPQQRDQLVSGIQSQFPAEADPMLAFLDETRDIGGLLGIVGFLGLLWTGSNLFGTMEHVFDRFYAAEQRSFIRGRLMALMMTAIFVVLMIFAVGANAAGHSIAELADWFLGFPLEGVAATIGLVVGWLVSLGSSFLLFFAIFKVVPNVPLSFKQVWKGALASAVGFVLLNQLFPLYLQILGGGFAAYKTFGLFLLLMTFFYFLALILVLGAEVNAFINDYGAETEAEARAVGSGVTTKAALPGKARRVQGRGAKVAQANARANGRASGQGSGESPGKVILWAGISAGITGLTLAAARSVASGIWRGLTGEEPPGSDRS